ncbi:MAG: DUF4340 domain-containing protein [candidate division Zixibacteria bacterium]|nr:DUF4340 domain-containing protein [candidate division Zixibacteria bacterium]
MKNKNFAVLIGVLVILIAIYLFQQLNTGKKSISESMINVFPDLKASSVSAIKVYKQDYPDSGLSFVKKDGAWLISSYFNAPAKENDIDKLLSDIKTLQGEVRSTKAELFDDYDIADSIALHVELLRPDSSELVHMLVGKGVPQASKSSFVRKFNADTVYIANQNFLSRFAVWNAEPAKKMPSKRWAEMKMTDVDKELVISFEIKAKRKLYRFEKKQVPTEDTTAPPKYIWEQIKPKKGKILEDKDIQPILNRIVTFNSQEIINDEILKEYGLTKPKYSVSFTTVDGKSTIVSFGNAIDTTSNAYYTSVDNKPFVYKVAKYNFESIFVNPFKDD